MTHNKHVRLSLFRKFYRICIGCFLVKLVTFVPYALCSKLSTVMLLLTFATTSYVSRLMTITSYVMRRVTSSVQLNLILNSENSASNFEDHFSGTHFPPTLNLKRTLWNSNAFWRNTSTLVLPCKVFHIFLISFLSCFFSFLIWLIYNFFICLKCITLSAQNLLWCYAYYLIFTLLIIIEILYVFNTAYTK